MWVPAPPYCVGPCPPILAARSQNTLTHLDEREAGLGEVSVATPAPQPTQLILLALTIGERRGQLEGERPGVQCQW